MSDRLELPIECIECKIRYTQQDKNKFYMWGGEDNYPSFKMELGDRYDICLSCVGKSSNLQSRIEDLIHLIKLDRKERKDRLRYMEDLIKKNRRFN